MHDLDEHKMFTFHVYQTAVYLVLHDYVALAGLALSSPFHFTWINRQNKQ